LTFLAQPDEHTDETQEAEISLGELVESRENAPIVFHLVDQALHQVAFFVEVSIIVVLLLAGGTRRDYGLGPTVQDNLAKWIGVVGLVGNHILAFVAGEQGFCLGDIMTLPTSQCKPQRVAQGVDVDMNLGAESASAAAQRLSRLPAASMQRACGRGMGTNDRAVENQMFHIGIICKMLMHEFPDALVTPASKSLVDAVPIAVSFGQQAPLGTAARDPQYAFQEEAAGCFLPYVDARTIAQEGDDHWPLIISYSDC